ncbi:molybdopterin-dependent oxidoreductase [Chloroflexota bacterium]
MGASASTETVIITTCNSHCGGACLLKVHVREGVITRIETDDGEEPQMRACLRGRAYRQRVYAPDRIGYPLKRVGERGQGKFERISWDEALDRVAGEIKRVRDSYGPASILLCISAGDTAWLHAPPLIDRVLCLAGGHSRTWGFFSYEAAVFAEQVTYGTVFEDHSREDLLNSKMLILWGWNPAVTIQGTNTAWYLAQAREKGIKIVSIDPRYTDTTAIFAHQWIPIRPGTDTAMMLAMAYVIITQDLQDQRFLDTYTVGFDRFREYILGEEDGVAKTPTWAGAITNIPSATIEALAIEYARTKPAALVAGISPGRTAFGEQYHRAAVTLTAMTGNIGVHGGSAAGRPWTGFSQARLGRGMPKATNPVEDEASPPTYPLPRHSWLLGRGSVNLHKVANAILSGKAGGYPADYKLLYMVNTNFLNQSANVNKTVRAFKSLEFIVTQEQFLTPTAKYADIVLPVSTFLERNDITVGGATTPFCGYVNQAIEPLYESRSHFEIASGLATRLEIIDFSDRAEEEWLKQIIAGSDAIADYDAFKKEGVHKIILPEPYVAFKKQIDDPANNPFPTPSGKIEIYSQRLADMNDPRFPPIPKYMETWESVNDPLAQKYPLQLITSHFGRRAHTQFDNLPWLQELGDQQMLINVSDAAHRGISSGDEVRVFNGRGEMVIRVKVTERIRPGVVDIPEGAWFAPDERGIDGGGCSNVLTRDEPSPCGALSCNTCLVQVEKA